MKTLALGFSYSKNSMQLRGLSLLDHYINFDEIIQVTDIDLPICDANSPHGVVPDSVEKFSDLLKQADILFFAIPEAGGHYSSGFKNAMDWLIAKENLNSRLGKGYSISGKPIYILTFTPAYKGAGGRHFNMTTELLEEKLGAVIRGAYVFNDCWKKLIPGNYLFVENQAKEILKDILNNNFHKYSEREIDKSEENKLNQWVLEYEKWNKLWEME